MSVRSNDFAAHILPDLFGPDGGLVAMLSAYMDVARKSDAIVSVAVALFRADDYRHFVDRWSPLVRRWQADAFHATDFYNGARPFFWWTREDGSLDSRRRERHVRDSHRVPYLIGKYSHQLSVISLKPDEFKRVAPLNWREHFGEFPRVIAQMTIGMIGHWADAAGYEGEIAYFFEDGDSPQFEDGLVSSYRNDKQRAHGRMAGRPVPVKKGKARGLEAADFLAWHWNKFYVDTYSVANTPRRPRADLRALLDTVRLGNKRVHTHLVTGPSLRTFLTDNGCV